MKWHSVAARAATLICVLFIALPRSAAAATAIFVRVAGIQGDSTDVRHAHWIDVLALGGGVTNPGSSGYGAAPTFTDVSILKRIDSASPLLFLTAAQGTQVDSVDIEFVKEGERGATYFKMRLSGVVISGVRTNASVSDDNITELVTFHFARIEWTWIPDGTPPVHGCWDLEQSQAC